MSLMRTRPFSTFVYLSLGAALAPPRAEYVSSVNFHRAECRIVDPVVHFSESRTPRGNDVFAAARLRKGNSYQSVYARFFNFQPTKGSPVTPVRR